MVLTEFLQDIVTGDAMFKAGSILGPLLLFAVGMFLYAVIVFRFYKLISKRNVLRLTEGSGDSPFHKVAYTFEYLFLFPVIAFLWFFMISILLGMLSPKLVISNIFMVAMATLATIRLTAYVDEELSKDVAKIIPFGLLAVLILDLEKLSLAGPLQVHTQLVSSGSLIVYYFIFIVVLEVILRLFWDWHSDRKKAKKEVDDSLDMMKKVKWSGVD